MVLLSRKCNNGYLTLPSRQLCHLISGSYTRIVVIRGKQRISFTARRSRIEQHNGNACFNGSVNGGCQGMGVNR
ncbi:hypothetical protein D3C72_1091100 [compost metagenome]